MKSLRRNADSEAITLQDGNAEACRRFEKLYREGWNVVWSAARPILPCDGDADDAVQRVFTRLWSSVSKNPMNIARPEQFLRQSGRREALLMLRERREHSLAGELSALSISSDSSPECQVIRGELRGILYGLIDHLPPRCGAVMRAILYAGLTHTEVAASLGIGVGAVEKQVTRAYAFFREQLRAMVPDVVSPGSSTFLDGG